MRLGCSPYRSCLQLGSCAGPAHVRTVGPPVLAQRSRPDTTFETVQARGAGVACAASVAHPSGMAEAEQPPAKRAKAEDKSEEGQSAPPAAQSSVRLPGREVNAQRARLWQQLGSNALLFDVTLKASDRDVPCNRSVPRLSLSCVCA